jgi:hypothetical protein
VVLDNRVLVVTVELTQVVVVEDLVRTVDSLTTTAMVVAEVRVL